MMDRDKDHKIEGEILDAEMVRTHDNRDNQAYSTFEHQGVRSLNKIEEDTRFWATVLHLSTLLGFVSFGAGLIVPIVIWQWKKSELPAIDAHGKIVVNAILSYGLYSVVAFFLAFILIGFLLFWVLGILFVLFPIIAALKAWGGQAWHYPFCFKFFS